MSNPLPTIVIAGAAGFVGSQIIGDLAKSHRVIALTRRSVEERNKNAPANIEWRQCDLFSLSQTRNALSGADSALYLVHSMLPSSQLTQAQFQDLDYLAADNFARAAGEEKLKQIVYVGGIIPDSENLSPHLASRKEVEQVLASHGTPVTTLRCGMIIGGGGSSLTMVVKLVERLPVMICPAWTLSKSAPVGIKDVCFLIKHYLQHPESESRFFDVGGGTTLSYREMIECVANKVGKCPLIFNVPLFSPGLSCLWVSLVTGAPGNLVAPLVASLRHTVLPNPKYQPRIPGWQPKPFDDILDEALKHPKARRAPHAFKVAREVWANQTVRSVQRIPLPSGWSVTEVAHAYLDWLPRGLHPFVRVDLEGQTCSFKLIGMNDTALLRLSLISYASHETRAVFRIVGGLLLKEGCTDGRLEFRLTHDGKHVIAAIHDYRPSLPWMVYCFTQAIVHKLVMYRFAHYLNQQA